MFHSFNFACGLACICANSCQEFSYDFHVYWVIGPTLCLQVAELFLSVKIPIYQLLCLEFFPHAIIKQWHCSQMLLFYFYTHQCQHHVTWASFCAFQEQFQASDLLSLNFQLFRWSSYSSLQFLIQIFHFIICNSTSIFQALQIKHLLRHDCV